MRLWATFNIYYLVQLWVVMLILTTVLQCDRLDIKLCTWLISEELTRIVRCTGAQHDGDVVDIGTDLYEFWLVHRKTQISAGNLVLISTCISLWGVGLFQGFSSFSAFCPSAFASLLWWNKKCSIGIAFHLLAVKNFYNTTGIACASASHAPPINGIWIQCNAVRLM